MLPAFAEGLDGVPDELVEALSAPLVDHHVHGCLAGPVARPEFETLLNEGSSDPVPPYMTQFDSQLGFAVRRWCAPLLGLEPGVPADRYWARRAELGADEVARLLLPAAGVGRWIVDPGYGAGVVTSAQTLAAWSGAPCSTVVRLESLGEELLAAGTSPADYPDAFRARLAAPGPVGAKSIVAYRCGFDLDWSPPSDAAVAAEVAAGRGAAADDVAAAGGVRDPRGGAGGPAGAAARRPRRPRPRPAPRRPDAAARAAAAAGGRPGAGPAAALLPVPPAGRLPGPGVPERRTATSGWP